MCTQKSPYNWSEQLYLRHGEVNNAFFNGSKRAVYSYLLSFERVCS